MKFTTITKKNSEITFCYLRARRGLRGAENPKCV